MQRICKRIDIDICLNHFAVHQQLKQHCKSNIFQWKKVPQRILICSLLWDSLLLWVHLQVPSAVQLFPHMPELLMTSEPLVPSVEGWSLQLMSRCLHPSRPSLCPCQSSYLGPWGTPQMLGPAILTPELFPLPGSSGLWCDMPHSYYSPYV